MLAVAATAAGLVTHRALASDPDSPREVAEQFMAANQRDDRRASWELLCHAEQVELGPLDRYVRIKDAAVATVGPFDADLTVRVDEVRPHGRSSPQSYVVDVELSRDGETHHQELFVVQVDGGFRVCGDP